MAAQRIIAGEGQIYVAGGVESISCVQQEMNLHMLKDPSLEKIKPEIYWNMLQTAEQVAKRYNIGRDRMDEYGAASQQKACAAQAAGKFTDEIAPILSVPERYDAPFHGREKHEGRGGVLTDNEQCVLAVLRIQNDLTTKKFLEVAETLAPLLFRSKRLADDSGGAGAFEFRDQVALHSFLDDNLHGHPGAISQRRDGRGFLGGEKFDDGLQHVINSFEHTKINRHLILNIFDLFMSSILPES